MSKIKLKCKNGHTVMKDPLKELPYVCRECGERNKIVRTPKNPETVNSDR